MDSSAANQHGNVKDGGLQGWLVVLGSHICFAFMFGVFQSMGPLFVAIQEHFNETSSRVSWVVSLMVFLLLIVGPFTNVCVKKIGFRLTVVIGTLMSSTGFLLSSFAHNVEFLYFFFGFLIGFGYGLIAPPAIGIIPLYIKKRYYLANAIAMSGSGIGALVLPPIFQALINFYGWRGALIVFSAINANMLISAVLFQMPSKVYAPSADDYLEDIRNNDNDQGKSLNIRQFLRKVNTLCDCSIFVKYPLFIVTCLAGAAGLGIGFYGVPAHLVARAKAQKIGTNDGIAWFASAMGIGNLLGRMSTPLFSILNRGHLTSARMYGICFLLSGVADLFSVICLTYPSYMTYAVIIGFLSGTMLTLFNQVLKDIVGDTMLTAAFGLAVPFEAVAGLFGPPCAGLIYDVTGDYNNSFYFYAAFSFLGGLIMLICEPIISRRQKTNTGTIDDKER